MPDNAATRRVSIVRSDARGRAAADDVVAVEAGLEVRLGGEPFAVIMRTPGADRDLVTGFLFSEGVVFSAADLGGIDVRSDDDVADVRLSGAAADRLAARPSAQRQVTMNASCGMCGRPSLASLAVTAPKIEATWTVTPETLLSMPARLSAGQDVFAETGGLHAAALVSPSGDVVDIAEDVGRHNAVDKIVGRALLDGRLPLSDRLLFVSGRASFEIVQKAWLAGIPLVAAVSAPSSLAIELAIEAGMTLVGFLRGDRFNVYAGRARVR